MAINHVIFIYFFISPMTDWISNATSLELHIFLMARDKESSYITAQCCSEWNDFNLAKKAHLAKKPKNFHTWGAF